MATGFANFPNFESIVRSSFESCKSISGGKLASYIPELTKVDPELFAVSLTSTEGETLTLGDSEAAFTLQSTSKPFSYALAIETLGEPRVRESVGVEPTGEAFDSIIELEKKTHRPYNPMINSGAIVIVNLLGQIFQESTDAKIGEFLSSLAGTPLNVDQLVFQSEQATAHRNRAISYLLKNFDILKYDLEKGLEHYFKLCSFNVNVEELSFMAACLAGGGIHPKSKKRLMTSNTAKRAMSLMMTCGMYDTAGEWAYSVGVPAKSGVSGAMFATVPGKLGIAAYSPLINQHGHSLKAYHFIENLISKMNLSVYQGGL